MVYFDNAATTMPKPEEVYVMMDSFYRYNGVSIGRGQYKLASIASTLVEDTRKRMLNLMHCPPQKRVVFTPSATEALNIVLQGLDWCDGQTVYMTPFEHNSVTRVLNYLQLQYELKIRQLSVNKKDLYYDLEAIEYQFQEAPPNVVIMCHASNVCGLVAPIKEISSLAKQHNSIVIVDMAQTAGLIDTDLCAIPIDYAVFAGHKTLYGPLGIGGFIVDSNSPLKPLLYGGTGIESADPRLPRFIPERFEVGSPNIIAIAGLNAALQWIERISINQIFRKEQEHYLRLHNILKRFKNVKLFTPKSGEPVIGVISCVFDGFSSDNIGSVLNQNNIAVRTGLHCSPTAHKFLGTFPDGTVRFSVSYFNKETDFVNLQNTLEYIQNNS